MIRKLFLIGIFVSALALLYSQARALTAYQGFHPSLRDQHLTISNSRPETFGPQNPSSILDSPGRLVGTTYYDYQTNGSTSSRIVRDFSGGVHFCWMMAPTAGLNPRYLYYGYISANGNPLPALQVDLRDGAGYPQIGVLRGSINPAVRNSAVLGYHNSATSEDRFATELNPGGGNFVIDSSGFPALPDNCNWPYFSIDINDNIQAIATQSNSPAGQLHYHIYSRNNFGSSNWTAPLIFDTTYNLSPIIISSPVSAKSAIVWTSPIFQDSNQYDNDVVYLESQDGVSWNVAGGRVNITNYPQSAIGDTTERAYTDVDAVYDFNDNLHIIWNAPHVTRDSSNQMLVLYHTTLYHWSQAIGTTVVYDHPDRIWQSDMGAWNLPISKMSIGVDADSNFLYVVFTRFDPLDHAHFDTINGDPNPCGGDNAMPCANGELYLTWSKNAGVDWEAPIDLTNTPSPDCLAGNCDSDNWSSMAELVDNYLHILYMDDKDAGGVAMSEGNATQNPVLYLRYPNPTRTLGPGCQYRPGDINNNGSINGVDVVYGVNFFKGTGAPPPVDCGGICPETSPFYAAGDVNGNCAFNGIDITYFVRYLKAQVSSLLTCSDCPPAN